MSLKELQRIWVDVTTATFAPPSATGTQAMTANEKSMQMHGSACISGFHVQNVCIYASRLEFLQPFLGSMDETPSH